MQEGIVDPLQQQEFFQAQSMLNREPVPIAPVEPVVVPVNVPSGETVDSVQNNEAVQIEPQIAASAVGAGMLNLCNYLLFTKHFRLMFYRRHNRTYDRR